MCIRDRSSGVISTPIISSGFFLNIIQIASSACKVIGLFARILAIIVSLRYLFFLRVYVLYPFFFNASRISILYTCLLYTSSHENDCTFPLCSFILNSRRLRLLFVVGIVELVDNWHFTELWINRGRLVRPWFIHDEVSVIHKSTMFTFLIHQQVVPEVAP